VCWSRLLFFMCLILFFFFFFCCLFICFLVLSICCKARTFARRGTLPNSKKSMSVFLPFSFGKKNGGPIVGRVGTVFGAGGRGAQAMETCGFNDAFEHNTPTTGVSTGFL